MKASLSQLAELTNGRIVGDPNLVIDAAAPLHSANAHAITFADRPDRVDWLRDTQACAVVLPEDSACELPDNFSQLRVKNARAAFEIIASYFRPARTDLIASGVSPQASVDPTAEIGHNPCIAPGVVLGPHVKIGDNVRLFPGVVVLAGASIDDNSTLFPNVVVYENCIIGKNCILHANAVIGAYGFGYDSSTGEHKLASQLGAVEIQDNVEVGACATIDRGAYDNTVIGEGSKIDNHVMIAHNCHIGKRNMICASVGVAGSVVTGDYVVMAGRVGVRDHVSIGDFAILGAMAGVMGDVPAKAKIVGIPATPEKEQMRKQVALAKLPDTQKEVKNLRAQLDDVLKRLEALENQE